MAKCENKRFGVKLLKDDSNTRKQKAMLYWRFEFNGKPYGDHICFYFRNDECEVAADEFVKGAILLQKQMETAAELLEKGVEDNGR